MTEVAKAVAQLKQGRLVAFPTETVYGLGADATNPNAINLIYQTKGRPSTNPLIIHVASIEIARRFVTHWPDQAQKLAEHFWPGPLTLVLPKRLPPSSSFILHPSSLDSIPDNATAGLQTVAIRIPNHPLALELLTAFDGPLAAPSANRSTRVSPTTAQHVRDEFPNHGRSEPALILDGGPCIVGIESTVLDLTTNPPIILRPGHITAADLEPLIGPVQHFTGHQAESTPATSPGQQETHYAPQTPAYRFETADRGKVTPDDHGIVALSPLVIFKDWETIFALPNDPAQYALHLYKVLRKLDTQNLKAIYIENPPDQPQWAAVRDRIRRATQPAIWP